MNKAFKSFKFFGSINLLLLLVTTVSLSQGYNHTWLLGYSTSSTTNKARIDFSNNNYSITPGLRKIPMWDTQGNISDLNGNLLMSSNGVFIADATGDTMQNGSGINPGQFTTDYSTYGLPLQYANIFLPMPGDSTKYVLFHETANYNATGLACSEIYFSIIDMNQNGGLGAVINKNNIIVTGLFGYGMSACKHGNGRDWWIVPISSNGSIAYKILLTPDTIQYIGSQNLSVPPYQWWGGQPVFSPDGEMFAFSHNHSLGTGSWGLDIRLFDFDRCTGLFNLKMYSQVGDTLGGQVVDTVGGLATSFSSNSRFLYVSSFNKIYQYDTDSSNIAASKCVVAVNDTFLSAPPVFYTNFFNMYRAANGKIYLSSGSSVLHLHEINYPDSAGLSCDVQLHNVYTGCFLIGVPNHANYYLGAKTGSPCDTLTSISELAEHDFHFKIFPNPVTDGNFKIVYLLPQNKQGKLEMFDITGKCIYKMNLPMWSTLQQIELANIANGLYQCVLTAGNERVSKTVALIKD